MVNCIYCGKDIKGKAVPVTPGKTPGAFQELTEVVVTHTNTRVVMGEVEVGSKDEDGKVTISLVSTPVGEETYTYDTIRIDEGEWQAGKEFPLRYRHEVCPAKEK